MLLKDSEWDPTNKNNRPRPNMRPKTKHLSHRCWGSKWPAPTEKPTGKGGGLRTPPFPVGSEVGGGHLDVQHRRFPAPGQKPGIRISLGAPMYARRMCPGPGYLKSVISGRFSASADVHERIRQKRGTRSNVKRILMAGSGAILQDWWPSRSGVGNLE